MASYFFMHEASAELFNAASIVVKPPEEYSLNVELGSSAYHSRITTATVQWLSPHARVISAAPCQTTNITQLAWLWQMLQRCGNLDRIAYEVVFKEDYTDLIRELTLQISEHLIAATQRPLQLCLVFKSGGGMGNVITIVTILDICRNFQKQLLGSVQVTSYEWEPHLKFVISLIPVKLLQQADRSNMTA